MGRKKAIRIAEAYSFERIIKDEMPKAGKWREFFQNNNPIVLEIGCGKGDYTNGLASINPEKNFLGIDKKIYRLWFGSKSANEQNLQNVAFLNTGAENLEEIFAKDEVDEIWITFPDPYPKDRHEDRRLVSSLFLDLYKKILKKSGIVHLKTDNLALFNFACESVKSCKLLKKTTDLYSEKNLKEAQAIQTTYEKKYLSEGKKICYLAFSFKD